jgi:broad specificity phosphatase PhoE
VHVPGGENYREAAARASSWVEELKADTFAVTHGAILRILRGLFLGLDWHGMNRLDEMQGVVFRIKDRDVTRLDAAGELG